MAHNPKIQRCSLGSLILPLHLHYLIGTGGVGHFHFDGDRIHFSASPVWDHKEHGIERQDLLLWRPDCLLSRNTLVFIGFSHNLSWDMWRCWRGAINSMDAWNPHDPARSARAAMQLIADFSQYIDRQLEKRVDAGTRAAEEATLGRWAREYTTPWGVRHDMEDEFLAHTKDVKIHSLGDLAYQIREFVKLRWRQLEAVWWRSMAIEVVLLRTLVERNAWDEELKVKWEDLAAVYQRFGPKSKPPEAETVE